MRRNHGKGFEVDFGGGECYELEDVTPPDLESEPEPDFDTDQELDEEPEPHAVVEVVHDPEPQPEESESEEEAEEPTVSRVNLEMPQLVPMALGDQEFTVSMRRVEVEPDNFIWSVKLVRDGEEVTADSDCSINDDLLPSVHPFQDNPV